MLLSFLKPKSGAESRAPAAKTPPPVARFRQMYERGPSFTNLLPWLDYEPTRKVFLLDDGRSLGALFELRAAGAEARPQAWLVELRDKLMTVLAGSLPETDPPWVVQFYVQDEGRLDTVVEQMRAYARPDAHPQRHSETWFGLLAAHLKDVSRAGGLFEDRLVTGGPWQGKRRRVRAALFRRGRTADAQPGDLTVEQELNDAAERFGAAMESAGISIRRCGGGDLYEWMYRWFNPDPPTTEGDVEALLKLDPWPGDDAEERPYGYDFSEQLMLGRPVADPQGLWWFDGMPHRAITVQDLKRVPALGEFTLERRIGDHTLAVFDRMPEHTVLVMTVTVQPQDQVRNHLARIEKASFGDYAEARLAGDEAHEAQLQIARGNKLFRAQIAVYVRGADEAQLRAQANRVNSLLLSSNLKPIHEREDLVALDTYIRNLPMAYDPEFDHKETRRSRLTFVQHLANLLPLYGRSVGTGNPGMLFFNRGGEPLMVDPLNLTDRKKNAHALILGPTGAGKSALLVYLILHMLAVHRPRIFLMEVGNSFGLLGQYLQTQGLTVHQLSLTPSADVSLPPFAEALKLLDARQMRRNNLRLDAPDDGVDPFDEEAEEDGDEDRDILGEMEIAARIMITGGDAREDSRMTRADRLLIREAIVDAARRVQQAGRSQVLTEDVVAALRSGSGGSSERRHDRAEEMADAMSLFCSGLAGHFFNRPGKPWPEADVTLVDLAILAREGYDDQLTVAFIGLMNHINALVERLQHHHRPTLVITDEGHIITTNPLLAPYVIKITKTWRKLGAWFWIATQNLEDFPDAARRMLSLLEWWLCLVMPKDEIHQIARFRQLSEEQTALLLAARKSPGQYTEGVLLTDHLAALFRNVPPPIALALAMTEKDEKAERAELMRRHACSELDAALLVAEQIAAKRRGE